MEFAESLGFEFELSPDGLLLVYPPAGWEWLGQHLHAFEDALKQRLRYREEAKLMECRGGPCDGKRLSFLEYPGKPVLHHLGRANWAVYVMLSWKGPAAWVGYSSSAKKGRELAREWWSARKPSETA
jgi:hypothetical protein